MLIDKKEIKDWDKFIKYLGYKCWDETNNRTYKLFLGASEWIWGKLGKNLAVESLTPNWLLSNCLI